MKLYNVPRNTLVRIIYSGEEVMFHHIDGMYSYCKNLHGEVVHLAAWTEVEIV